MMPHELHPTAKRVLDALVDRDGFGGITVDHDARCATLAGRGACTCAPDGATITVRLGPHSCSHGHGMDFVGTGTPMADADGFRCHTCRPREAVA